MRQLTAMVWLEQALVIVVGMALGIWMGARLGATIMPFLGHDDWGRQVMPPFVMEVDWGALIVTYGIMVLLFVLIGLGIVLADQTHLIESHHEIGRDVRTSPESPMIYVISGNSATGYTGGGIENEGSITVVDSTISGNNASTTGGGIQNEWSMTVVNSTISGNSASTGGGGIYSDGSDPLTVSNSTISGNSAHRGARAEASVVTAKLR